VRSPEKAGVGGSTPSLATILFMSVPETWVTERSGDIGYTHKLSASISASGPSTP
jgi:hypothetical protein